MTPALLEGLLTARSLIRGVPPPAADRGGFRIDAHRPEEARRWVFPAVCDGLIALGSEVELSRHLLQACVADDRLRAVLPQRWEISASCYVMVGGRLRRPRRLLPIGYTLECAGRREGVVEARICTLGGGYAASGYAAAAGGVSFYDRIETTMEHGGRGLGAAIMDALSDRQPAGTCDLLIATSDDRTLYEDLGWSVVCPYSTAFCRASTDC